jgi:UDP-N-acetylglucosamine 3-dehydrogenase
VKTILRVGIVGAGWIGQWHAQRWLRLPVKLVGFYDVNDQTAQQAADTYGGQVFSGVEQLVRAVDIVQICTPTVYHKEQVLEAAAQRKQIFCEKPLARHLSDAQEIISACEAAGVRLFVGHVLRFFPQYVRARQLIHEGAIGTPGLIRLLRAAAHPATSSARAWFKSVEQTGGCVLEGAIHDLDFARWCLGEADRVFARGLTFREDLDVLGDHALATVRFRSGAIGHVESSWMVTDGRFRQRFEIAGDSGLLQYDSLPAEHLAVSLRATTQAALLPVEPLRTEDEPYYRQLAHYLDCLLHDREFRVSPQDALEALRLSLAVLESMRRGKVVNVEEVV